MSLYKDGMFVLLLTLFAFINGSSRCNADGIGAHVRVTNMLKGKMNLQIHCKSKNDDLGKHVIPYTKHYEFSFIPNIFLRTLFFCSFVSNNQLHWFDIFVGGRDEYCSNLCPWTIQETGPCFIGLYNTSKCYEWNKKKIV